jgi:hypothetical protein
MIECGIKTVVYDKEYNSLLTEEILKKGGIQVIKFKRTFDKFK